MPYVPSVDATLLRRRNTGTAGPDLYNFTESWYEPATRTSNAYLTTGTDPTEFTLPVTVIVDRYCLAPGVAPYTEARVHRTGFQGAIATDYVDGVTTCQIVCTLTVALTASAVANGRATLTATLQGAQGPVLLSLDGFQTPGRAPDTATTAAYLDCRPGTYTVTARETRAGGCTATATVTFTAPYGVRYEVHFYDLDGTPCLLQVAEREYTGPVEELTAQQEVLVLDWPGGATDHVYTQLLRGSQCQLALYLMRDEQLLPLFSGDERLHRATYSRAGAVLWTGYLLPEQYDVAFLTPPTTFNLTATDGLGTLSTIPFAGAAGERLRGDWPVLQVLLFCLGKLDLALPLNTLFNLAPAGAVAGVGPLEQFVVDVAAYQDEQGKPWDCGRVLTALLTPFAARLYQWAGAWWLERLADLRPDALTYLAYAPTGARLADLLRPPLQTVQAPAAGRPHWLNGSQRQNLRPAVGTVTVAADPGEPVNLLRFALPTVADLPGPFPFSWTGASATPAVPWAQLLYAGKDKAPVLRLFGNRGPVAGYADNDQALAAGLRQPWVQLPVAPPLPLPAGQGGAAQDAGTLILRFRAKPSGHTPTTATGKYSFLVVAVRFGDTWLGGVTGQLETVLPQTTSPVDFTAPDEVAARVVFGNSLQVGPRPVQVRIYTPVGGASDCTVDLSEFSLHYETVTAEINDAYTTRYHGNTGQLVSRVDEGTTLFHADVPHQRRAGTWLDRNRLPVRGWVEPGSAGGREAGDYLVRDRLSWQAAPAPALAGTLRGQLNGPGTLLTDPTETRPGVYVLTACQHRAAAAEWDATGVQDLLLAVPGAALPDFAIYFDNDTAWLDESGRILVYENAF